MFLNIGKINIKQAEATKTADWTQIKSANDLCEDIDNEMDGYWYKHLFSEDKYKEFKLKYKLAALTEKDSVLDSVLRQELEEKVEYSIQIDDLNEEIEKFIDEENEKSEEYNKRINELLIKSEDTELTEEEYSELKELQNKLFTSDENIKDKKTTINNEIKSVKSKAFKGDSKSTIANGYVNKTYSVASDLEEKDKNIDVSKSVKAADNLAESAAKYSKYERLFK